MQRWRVPLGFLCGLISIVVARPNPITILIGSIIAILGLLLRAWASGHIRKNSSLTVSGPYSYTRNPLYLGSFLLGLGFVIAAGQPILWIIFAILFLGIYLPVMRVEERVLAGAFGEEYERYARAVPLFLPSLMPYREVEANSGFDTSLYMRYREYRAAFGLLIALTILVLKAYWWR
jgi:protein-S-isoprenylcysteine O-methyltransferase Ste14